MKSNTYKMFITDLDGTLLDDRKNISEENIIALKKLTDHQVFITVFTGRNYLSAKRFIDALGIDIPVVFQNGAFIMNPKSKEVLYQSMLPGPEARSITEIALASGLEVVAYKGFLDLPDMMVERTDWLGFPYESYIRNNSHRIQIVDSLLETIPELLRALSAGGDRTGRRASRVGNESARPLPRNRQPDSLRCTKWERFPRVFRAAGFERDRFGKGFSEISYRTWAYRLYRRQLQRFGIDGEGGLSGCGRELAGADKETILPVGRHRKQRERRGRRRESYFFQ